MVALKYMIVVIISTAEGNACQRFCEAITRICHTPSDRMRDAQPYAYIACFGEHFATDDEWLDSSSKMWLHDIGCDALRMLTDFGFMGYAFLDANATTATEEAWTQLLDVCSRRPRCKKDKLRQMRDSSVHTRERAP